MSQNNNECSHVPTKIFKFYETNDENIRTNDHNKKETPSKQHNVKKMILYSAIPKDYKYRMYPSQVRSY